MEKTTIITEVSGFSGTLATTNPWLVVVVVVLVCVTVVAVKVIQSSGEKRTLNLRGICYENEDNINISPCNNLVCKLRFAYALVINSLGIVIIWYIMECFAPHPVTQVYAVNAGGHALSSRPPSLL